MAKKLEETTQKDDQIATQQQPGALEQMPADLMRDAGKGTEEIGPNDVKPPRIRICQSGSPQRKPDNLKQIPGLNELDIFNDLTGENYGRGPLKFIVLKVLPVRHIEFAPFESGGGVVDFNVPATDPRAQFRTDPNTGKRVKPIATTFRDFLAYLPDHQEIAVISMKGSQLDVAETLNSKIKYMLKPEALNPAWKGRPPIMNPPAWTRTFSLRTISESDSGNSWGNYVLTQEGITPTEMRELCSSLASQFASKNILVDREPGDEDATSFNPAEIDNAPTTEM